MKKRSKSRQSRIVRRHVSASGKAYCTSTMSVTSGPTAARTAAITSVTRSNGASSPWCRYGPANVASSLAARKPAARAVSAAATSASR